MNCRAVRVEPEADVDADMMQSLLLRSDLHDFPRILEDDSVGVLGWLLYSIHELAHCIHISSSYEVVDNPPDDTRLSRVLRAPVDEDRRPVLITATIATDVVPSDLQQLKRDY